MTHRPQPSRPIGAPLPTTASRRTWLRLAGAAAASGMLASCGFAIRQAPKFAFDSLLVTGTLNSPVSRALQRNLSSSGVQVLRVAGQPPAQAVMNITVDQRERAVVGQNASGQVSELQLRTRFRFSLSTLKGRVLQEDTEMLLERDITFSETAAIAKAIEEQMLFNDMESDIVQQVMRRLAAVQQL